MHSPLFSWALESFKAPTQIHEKWCSKLQHEERYHKQDKEIKYMRKTFLPPSLLKCVLYKQAVKLHQGISSGI